MEPVIDEFDEGVYMAFKKAKKGNREFLGYYYDCVGCGKEGYIHNKHQLMCPKCGVPFHFNKDYPELTPYYAPAKGQEVTKNFDQPQFIADTCMGEEVIVKDEITQEVFEAFKHLDNVGYAKLEDIVTDMEDSHAI